jgi:GcrA cell cycle regulator
MMPAPITAWTETRVERLIHLWDVDGLSAGIIAERLGGTTRNAVLGKLGRLGKLGNRQKGQTRRHTGGMRRRSSAPKVAATAKRAPLFHPVRKAAPVSISIRGEPEPRIFSVLDLREGHCRYPSGEPGQPGFAFCGHPAPGSYCRYHDGITHR